MTRDGKQQDETETLATESLKNHPALQVSEVYVKSPTF